MRAFLTQDDWALRAAPLFAGIVTLLVVGALFVTYLRLVYGPDRQGAAPRTARTPVHPPDNFHYSHVAAAERIIQGKE
jgi:hypothetical protein